MHAACACHGLYSAFQVRKFCPKHLVVLTNSLFWTLGLENVLFSSFERLLRP